MSPFKETDKILINRDGFDYQTTLAELRKYVTPDGGGDGGGGDGGGGDDFRLGTWSKLGEYLQQFDSGIADARWSGTGKKGAAKDYVYMGIEWAALGDEDYNEKTGLYRVKRADWDPKSPLDNLEKVFYFWELPDNIHGAGTQLSGQDGGYWIITEDLIIKDRYTDLYKNLYVTLDGGKTWKESPKMNINGQDSFLGAYCEDLGGGKYKFLEAGGPDGLNIFNRFIEVTIDSTGGISCTGEGYDEYPYCWPVQANNSDSRVTEHSVANNLVCKDSNGYYVGVSWNVYRWENFIDDAEWYKLNDPTDKPPGVGEWEALQMYWDSKRNKYLLIGDWKDSNWMPKQVGIYEFSWGDTTPTKHPLMDVLENDNTININEVIFSMCRMGKVYKNNEVVGWTLTFSNVDLWCKYDADGYLEDGSQKMPRGLYGSCEDPTMWTASGWQNNKGDLSASLIYSEEPRK